jgi:hypothetical protein
LAIETTDLGDSAKVNGVDANVREPDWAKALGVDPSLLLQLISVNNMYSEKYGGDDDWESGTTACREYVEENILPLLPD